EHRTYAAAPLSKSRSLAIPYIVAELRQVRGEEREALLYLLPRLAPETAQPLLAALDIPDPDLRVDLIGVLAKDAIQNNDEALKKQVVANLWYLAASKKADNPERVRTAAT